MACSGATAHVHKHGQRVTSMAHSHASWRRPGRAGRALPARPGASGQACRRSGCEAVGGRKMAIETTKLDVFVRVFPL